MTFLRDARYAARSLRKNLSVTLIAVTSLAVAVAGNTTVYSLVNSFLYRPLPYEEVERLMVIGERNSDLQAGLLTTTSRANFLEFRERQKSFQGLAAYEGDAVSYDAGGDQPEQLAAGRVTPGFFELLGAEQEEGRPFVAEEGVPGRDRVVLLSHDFWRDRFAAESDIVGETLKLDGESYEVVGVVGEGFEWIAAPNTKVWLPLALEHGAVSRQTRNTFAIGRLARGKTAEAARAEMDTLMAQLVEEYPEANAGYQVQLLNMREDIPDARNRLFMSVIQVALLFVLLIACANIANLLLARSQAREREMAIRTSIGASRRRIILQLMSESLILALLSGGLGLVLGIAGMRMLQNALTGFVPSFWLPAFDWRVLAYCLGVTLLGGVLFGLAPVIQTSRFDLLSGLKDGNQGATMSGKRRWAASSLVVLELAFALAFLAGASMMIRTFKTMQSTEAGFETEHLLVMRVGLPESRYGNGKKQVLAAEQVVSRLESLAGVRAATVSSLLPRMPFISGTGFEIAGQPAAEDQPLPQVPWLAAGPRYFDAVGIPLLHGRVFTEADRPGAPEVAVINTAMAKRFFSGRSALGQRLSLLGKDVEIVGVVEDVKHDVFVTEGGDASFVYLPWQQAPERAFAAIVRTEVAPESLTDSVRRELLTLDQGLSVTQIQSLDSFVDQFWVGQNIFIAILAGFGAVALFLAALGTYGVLAYSVARRRHEIGIRMAIGASRAAVLRMVIRQGLLLGLLGLLLGLPLILVQIRVISAIFAGVVPVEPSSVVGVVLVLALVTLVASAVPARRAIGVDPIEALRYE